MVQNYFCKHCSIYITQVSSSPWLFWTRSYMLTNLFEINSIDMNNTVFRSHLNSSGLRETYNIHYTVPFLVDILARHLRNAKRLSELMWTCSQWQHLEQLSVNLNQNTAISVQENWLRNVVCKSVAILSWPQCDDFEMKEIELQKPLWFEQNGSFHMDKYTSHLNVFDWYIGSM